MDQKSGKLSQKRRAILQGSLAAPLVLTVSSAGAQAALSSSARALQNLRNQQPRDPADYFSDTQSPDKWFRKAVTVQKLQNPAGEQHWYYFDPVRNVYYRVSTLGGDSAFARMTFGATLPSAEWVFFPGVTKTKYLMVWVNPDNGAEAAQTAEPVDGRIGCTCSALNSITPGACNPTGNLG